jgi:hypothetical protein
MPRSMVGLLTAVGTAMSALVAFAHGSFVWVAIADAAAATGLAAYLALSPIKKSYHYRISIIKANEAFSLICSMK